MSLELYFPPLCGGKVQGLNDSGIETFEGAFQKHIVRECGQNAVDAKNDSQPRVTVRIQLRSVPASQIPSLLSLRTAVQSAKEYWASDAKTVGFCRKAIEWTAGTNVEVLEISDYGTTGLEGDDKNTQGSWFGLVRSEGVSNKPGGAGGAFGIGKDAPFAGSFIRCIFYSTLNQSGGYAFQGVCKLATHIDDQKRETQQDGFIGVVDRAAMECRAVRNADQIPAVFRREKVGTSIFILAYRHLGGDDWADEYVRQAVENFWPAIHKGNLVFEIGSRKVETANLPMLMNRYSSYSEFITHYYYQAIAGETRLERSTTLPSLGMCRIYLTAGDATFPKKVCMTRQTGMVIYEASRFKSYRPFSGLFICESRDGNAYLRRLEPPRHDLWDAARADDESESRQVLKSIREWINECLRELNPDNEASEAEVPELNRYLPDDTEEPLVSEAPQERMNGGNDGIISLPVEERLHIQVVAAQPPTNRLRQNHQAPADGNESGDGEGTGGPLPQQPESTSKGGKSPTEGAGTSGGATPRDIKISLKTRSAQISPGVYRLILRAPDLCTGTLRLVTVGEDNKEDSDLQILRVVDVKAQKDITSETLSFDPDIPLQLEVSLKSQSAVSLRAYCHGN